MHTTQSLLRIFTSLLGLVVASFVLWHVLALFGVFLALMYPIWWLLAPDTVPCLVCRTRKKGSFCPICRDYVDNLYLSTPRNFRSSVFNGLIIFSISAVSIFIIMGESLLLKNVSAYYPSNSISFEIPSEGQYRINEIFEMPIQVTGIKRPINAIQADFVFNPHILELIEIDTTDSFASVFIQKTMDNQIGFGRISGGLPNPGFFAEKGTFALAVFKARQAGLASIRFIPSSLILENDGNGSNLISNLASANYIIVPEEAPQNVQQRRSSTPSLGRVSGVTDDTTQLKFFDDTPKQPAVLGDMTASQAAEFLETEPEEKKFCISCSVISVLTTIDHFILSFWDRVADILFA